MRAFIYTRTSTRDQELSHSAQEAQCREHAAAQGWEVMGVWQDRLSGSVDVTRRKGFVELIQHLKKGDVLMVAKRDRLGRDLMGNAVAESLILKHGAKLLALDCTSGDDAGAVFMRHVIDAVAQYERGLTSERTRAALAEKQRRGEALGSPQRGYKSDEQGQLVENQEEREAVERTCAWRRAGLSIKEIQEKCMEFGITSRRGTLPSLSTLSVWTKQAAPPREERPKIRPNLGVPSPQRLEANVVGLKDVILDLHERGLTQREMVTELERRGYRTRNGRPYTKTQIWRVLQRALSA